MVQGYFKILLHIQLSCQPLIDKKRPSRQWIHIEMLMLANKDIFENLPMISREWICNRGHQIQHFNSNYNRHNQCMGSISIFQINLFWYVTKQTHLPLSYPMWSPKSNLTRLYHCRGYERVVMLLKWANWLLLMAWFGVSKALLWDNTSASMSHLWSLHRGDKTNTGH